MTSIPEDGWTIVIARELQQKRGLKVRTVGTYQVYHNGIAQSGADMRGAVAESRGPGANRPRGNGRRVEPGKYPLATQAGTKYVTLNFPESKSSRVVPRPGIELLRTGAREEILIHPGIGFIASIGCLNLCTSLPNESENISYNSSYRRVVSVINDLRKFTGINFPMVNGKPIPRAWAVILGEPS